MSGGFVEGRVTAPHGGFMLVDGVVDQFAADGSRIEADLMPPEIRAAQRDARVKEPMIGPFVKFWEPVQATDLNRAATALIQAWDWMFGTVCSVRGSALIQRILVESQERYLRLRQDDGWLPPASPACVPMPPTTDFFAPEQVALDRGGRVMMSLRPPRGAVPGMDLSEFRRLVGSSIAALDRGDAVYAVCDRPDMPSRVVVQSRVPLVAASDVAEYRARLAAYEDQVARGGSSCAAVTR